MARQRGQPIGKEAESLQLSRERWERLVNEWINNERDRYIIKRHILDGVGYIRINRELEEMGEYPLSDRALAKIISKGFDKISKHI